MIQSRLSKQVRGLIETHCPFGFVTVNGYFENYSSTVDAYMATITSIWANCPRGWVDLVWVGCKFQGLLPVQARRIYGRKHLIVIPVWDKPSEERNNALKKMCMSLLRVTGVVFSENAFKAALWQIEEHKIFKKEKENEFDNVLWINYIKSYGVHVTKRDEE